MRPKKNLFITFFFFFNSCLLICVCMDACAKALVWSEDNLREFILFLHHVGSRNQIRHGSQAWGQAPSLSYLANPVYFLKQGLHSHALLELATVDLIQPWDYRHERLYLS